MFSKPYYRSVYAVLLVKLLSSAIGACSDVATLSLPPPSLSLALCHPLTLSIDHTTYWYGDNTTNTTTNNDDDDAGCINQSVMDFPRLTRDEEVALGEDVQRWQQLERVRGRVVVAAGGSEEMRLDAWAAAADISVEVRRRDGPGAGRGGGGGELKRFGMVCSSKIDR